MCPPEDNPFIRVLYLEDNLEDAELISHQLQQEWPACELTHVMSREQFSDALQQQEFDIILSDFTLAGFDGLAALGQARRLRPATPFVFVSGTIGEERAVEALKHGATDYVLKDRRARLVPSMLRALHDAAMRRSRQAAEAAIRESEEKFSKAFRAVPDAVIITDLSTGKVVDVNEGCERLYGYPRNECLGRTTAELGIWLNPADREVLFQTVRRQDGGARNLEVKGRTRAGSIVDVVVSCESIEVEGRPHLVTIVHDITARRQMEKVRAALEEQLRQSQKLDALGQLAGGIAHDFNNILTGVVAYTELAIMDADQPAAVRQHLGAVREACQRATDLVRQILAFSRQRPLERRPVRLNVVVHEAVKLLRASLSKMIEVQERLDSAVPAVLADSTQIHQVIMNLGTNAAHAMRGERGRLTVELDVFEAGGLGAGQVPAGLEPGRYARIVVSDTGCGMSSATLERIFEPFFTTKPPGEGTGLGLPMVRSIMDDHDGMIAVESREGKGTRVTLFFPENSGAALVDEPKGAVLPRGDGRRILLIDDDVAVGVAAAEALKRSGYAVTLHSDPRSAWAEFDAAPAAFDAVVTDLTMPHLSGVELVGRMLTRRADLPIVMMTGAGAGWTAERLQILGIRTLVSKPMSATKLLAALHEVLA